MPSVEWYYDASTSPLLRLFAHLPPAALGGALMLFVGAAAVFVITNLAVLLSPTVLLFVLLLVVGGPASLAYLWPMLTDADQRPSAAEFEGGGGFPFSAKSVSAAAVSGAVGLLALILLGVPFEFVYRFVVGCVFSPLLVAAVTTHGSLEDGTLTINRTEIPLARVANVRSVRVRGFVVAWLSYARRSGVFLPRVIVIPAAEAEDVLTVLRNGIDADPEIEPPDRAVRGVLFGVGVFFFAVAALAYGEISDTAVRRYVTVGLGGLGSLLCLVGWRGV